MTVDGVVKAAKFRRMNEESRWNVDNWNALRGLPWDVTETGAEATEVIQAPLLQIIRLLLTPRRRCVTRADLRKHGVTSGCSACSDTAVHVKTSKHHTEECRNRIGEQTEHDPEGHERALVARENETDPAPKERLDVEMPAEELVGSASVKHGSDAVADNEERAPLRLRAEGKRGQKHD